MELEVKLTTPIELAVNGEMDVADVVYFNAPTAAQKQERTRLIVMAQNAMLSAAERFKEFVAEDNSHTQSADLDAEAVKQMLRVADKTGDLLCAMQKEFDSLVLKPGIAFMHESHQKMTKDLWAQVSLEDQDNCLAEYVANFIIAALGMSETKKT